MPARAKRIDSVPPYVFAELSRIKTEAEMNGATVIDLGVGDPDLATPEPIRRALQAAVENPATHHYDLSPRGWKPFIQAATDWYLTRFGTALNPAENALQVIGSKEGLAHLCWTYLDPGDVAIVPCPAYTVYKVNALMAGAEVYEYDLTLATNFTIDFDSIPDDICKRAKLLFTCYPNNPTGAIAPEGFYEKAVDFCRRHDILLVSDLAYSTVGYDGYRPPSALQVPGAVDVTVEFHSLSKMFRMTGWRLGFALGNSEALTNLQRMKSNIDTKAFAAIAEAGAYALRNVDPEQTNALYRRRRDRLCAALERIGMPVTPPRAGFYIWLPVPSGWKSYEYSMELLRKAHVMVVPGDSYGAAGEGYVRLSLTLEGDQDGELFESVAERIAMAGMNQERS